MVVYISGAITGKIDYLKTFNEAEKELKEMGHIPINPCCVPLGLNWQTYMIIDLAMVEASDAILMLNGWQDSKGAKQELERAIQENKKIYRYDTSGEIVEFVTAKLALQEANEN
jgi:hypothetical protein